MAGSIKFCYKQDIIYDLSVDIQGTGSQIEVTVNNC